MILQGLISKFGAVFIIIPEPIVGGIFCVMFGMICAFGVVKAKILSLPSDTKNDSTTTLVFQVSPRCST